MLTENIRLETGLVNGAIGTLEGFAWPPDTADLCSQQPMTLLIYFPVYNGRPLSISEEGKPLVSVFPSRQEFVHNNAECSRFQFSVTVAYAITVHKSLGITVLEAVLNIKEFSTETTRAVAHNQTALRTECHQRFFSREMATYCSLVENSVMFRG